MTRPKSRLSDAYYHAEAKRQLLNIQYIHAYVKWKNCTDDRKLFCNTLEILYNTLDVMEQIENNFIWVAFTKKFNEECDRLDAIMERFKEEKKI